MLGLVETYFTSAGKADFAYRPPSSLLHFRTPDALPGERRYLSLQVVTHKIKLVPAVLFGGMNRHFGRGHRENQPTVAGVHGRESEDVAEEGAIRRRILAVDNYVGAKDHAPRSGSRRTIGYIIRVTCKVQVKLAADCIGAYQLTAAAISGRIN
jgi:hypothetical protein